MPSVSLINNYPQKPLIKGLEDTVKLCSGLEVKTIGFDDPRLRGKVEGCDAIVLSGSPELLSVKETSAKFNEEILLLKEIEKPVLGICFGHQLLAIAFGGNVVPLNKLIKGFYKVKVLVKDPLFKDLPGEVEVAEAHREAVDPLPKGFINLATSPECKVEAMKHQLKKIYGIQFHAERFSTEKIHGKIVLENFFKLIT